MIFPNKSCSLPHLKTYAQKLGQCLERFLLFMNTSVLKKIHAIVMDLKCVFNKNKILHFVNTCQLDKQIPCIFP